MKDSTKKTFRNHIFIFLILCVYHTTFAQKSTYESPYKVTWKGDGIAMGIGVASYVGGLINIIAVDDRTDEEVLALDKNDLKWKINRRITENDSEVADGFSDGTLYASYAGAITLFAASDRIRNKKNFIPTLIVFTESYLFTRAATFWTKSEVGRFRPYAYNPEIPLERRRSDSATTSFFSGHASTSSVLCFTTAKMFADHYPDSKAKPYVWAGAAAIPLVTSYLRLEAGRHFLGDVAVGYSVGALFGILVPHFHKKAKEKDLIKNKKTSFQVYPAEGGLGLTMQF